MDKPHRKVDAGEALTWLLRQPNGAIETSVSGLARRWGWNRTKVFQRLNRWADEGHIVRKPGPAGRSVISVVKSPVGQPAILENILPGTAQNVAVLRGMNWPLAKSEHCLFGLLPSVSVADPHVEIASSLVQWATFGVIGLSEEGIRIARISAMTLLPQVTGLVLMLAAALWHSRVSTISSRPSGICERPTI
jgi:hypothetical protein